MVSGIGPAAHLREVGVDVLDGAEVTAGEIVEFCRERMAAYKYPRDVRVLAELPKSATGKILKRDLRQLS